MDIYTLFRAVAITHARLPRTILRYSSTLLPIVPFMYWIG